MRQIIIAIILLCIANLYLLANPFHRNNVFDTKRPIRTSKVQEGTFIKKTTSKFNEWKKGEQFKSILIIPNQDLTNIKFKKFAPTKITTKKPKQLKKSNKKTTLKNVNILTDVKTGNINTKGKLSIAHVKIQNGATLKNTNINAEVKTKNISVSKGSSADIGSVKIEN